MGSCGSARVYDLELLKEYRPKLKEKSYEEILDYLTTNGGENIMTFGDGRFVVEASSYDNDAGDVFPEWVQNRCVVCSMSIY